MGERAPLHVLCQHCEENLATCLGAYEGMDAKQFACDDCCGHAGEDGHCDPINEQELQT